MRRYAIFVYFLIISILSACEEKPTPKPRGFFRIDFPEKSYTKINNSYPYLFEIPDYSHIEEDTSPDAEKHWANIVIPKHKARIHLSYKAISENLDDFVEDSHEMVFAHTIKADAIDPKEYNNESHNVYGVLYEIKGNTASSVQFVATDSTHHFLRGALYLNEVPQKDSLAPVLEFLKYDVVHLMNTLEWKK